MSTKLFLVHWWSHHTLTLQKWHGHQTGLGWSAIRNQKWRETPEWSLFSLQADAKKWPSCHEFLFFKPSGSLTSFSDTMLSVHSPSSPSVSSPTKDTWRGTLSQQLTPSSWAIKTCNVSYSAKPCLCALFSNRNKYMWFFGLLNMSKVRTWVVQALTEWWFAGLYA